MNRTCRVGVHGRNDIHFHEADYTIIREAKIEAIKMMSQTHVDHFKRLSQMPNMELITRLYDDRFGRHGHPSPEEFATRMVPVMKQLQPYCTKFEIHNEPNHLDRIEGWGDSDDDARSFRDWYLRTFDILKSQCPWSQLGFPGLAISHRDLEWVEICRPAVEKSDWLGVHCYWQTPPDQMHNHLADFWGLRFKYYHEKFPDKVIDLTEVGNSNVQNGIPFTRETHAREFTEYLTECFKYPYLNSASFFIMSSPDPTWDGFAWRNESGQIYPITRAVRDMQRPFWTQVRVAVPAQPRATSAPQPAQTAQPAPAQTQQPQSQPAKTEITQLSGEVQQLRTQNNQLQSQLQQIQSQNARLQQQIQQIQAQVSTVTGTTARPAAVTAPADRPDRPRTFKTLSRVWPEIRVCPLATRRITQINRIIIHHTAVPADVGAERIAVFLVNNRGRPGIAYHYFVTAEGLLQQTNALTTVTEQSTPELNIAAVGIGFAGNFNTAAPTPAQIESGAQLIAWLLSQLNLSIQSIFGHKELTNTQSPGAHWDSGVMWGNQLKQRVQAYLIGAL